MRIAGVDEVGRGPLAGPVVAAAVVFENDYINSEIKDSKKLSRKKREELYEQIKSAALYWAIAVVGPQKIDEINIREAAKLAMSSTATRTAADLVLVDGNMALDIDLPQETVIKGDAKHIQISAASILAKVWRDKDMLRLNLLYPGYGFEKHAGYPTKMHKEAVAELGPSPVHRLSFRGVKEHVHNFQTDRQLSAEIWDQEEIVLMEKEPASEPEDFLYSQIGGISG